MKRKVQKKTHRLRNILIVVTVLFIAVAGAGAYWWHKDHKSNNSSANTASTQTARVKTSTQPITSQQPAPQSVVTNPTPTPNPNVPSGSTNSTTGTLAAPSGTFVSNHEPSLSDASRSQEVSDCTTTPGATCDITFTQGSTVKSLGQTTTATSGSTSGIASWNWTPQSLGLTTGTWSITATATLNGQTKTTSDPTKLSVQP